VYEYLIGIRNLRTGKEETFTIAGDSESDAKYRAEVYVNFHPKYKSEAVYQRESIRVIRQLYGK